MNAHSDGTPSPSSKPFHLPTNPWVYTLLSCFLLLILLAARLIHDFDLGYHLKGGQWILQNHCVPTEDGYTYTVPGHPYLDIHWLYQVTLYTLYSIGSYPLLSIFNILLLLTGMAITFKRLRLSGAPYGICVLLLAVLVITSETRFQVRPEILSWTLMALTLWVLDLRFHNKKDLLFLLPFIQVLWVNVEGLFPIGWILMGAYTLYSLVHSHKWDKKLLKFSALSIFCDLLNPNLFHGVLFPFNYLATLGTSNTFKQNIAELQPTWTVATNDYILFVPWLPLFFYKVYCFLLLALFLATLRHRKIQEILLAACFFYLSTTALRNMPLFMWVTVPIAAACWKDLPWETLKKTQGNLLSKPLTAWIFTFLLLLFSTRVITNAYYTTDRRIDRFGLGLDGDKLPVKATQFLWDNKLDGRILNQLNSGGWLVWKGPQKDFIDGRLEVMGEKFFSEYMTSFAADGLNRLADKYQADIILFNAFAAPVWIFELKKDPNWRLVYLDGYFAIYLRKSYAPQVPDIDYSRFLGTMGLDKGLSIDTSAVLQAPRISKAGTWLEGFILPQTYPDDLLTMAIFNFDNDHSSIAEPIFLDAIHRTRGRYFEFYLDAGMMYAFNKQTVYAEICAQRILEDDPSNHQAQQLLAQVRQR